MPKKLDDCVKALIAAGKTEEQAHAICQTQFSDTYTGEFRDSAVFNASEKSAVSVRDGVIEYLGIELNMEPPDRVFTVFRSPATIANTAMKMRGLPITDEHVPLGVPPPTSGGFVAEAEMVDAHDESTMSTIAIRNQLAISDTLRITVEAGKRELSLGYHGDLVPHDEYDFEQRNIKPHHLAAVERGRCGSMCSFIDKKPEDKPVNKLHKAFNDAEGAMNLQQIVELATALPEAIKAVPVDQLQELLPALQQIVEAAKGVMPDEEKPAEEAPLVPEVPVEPEVPAEDAEPNPDDEEKEGFSDADVQAFTDKAIKLHTAAIEKARGFLAEDYQFADKSTADIMRDALATVETDAFADDELALAFKLLKKPDANYKEFADKGITNFTNLKDKEL